MNKAENIYDVVIIGGGLAGLTLSIQCADAGYNTILFEKETYPFHKVCGEYISLESYAFLESLGLKLKKFDLPFIKKLQLTDVAGQLYEFDLDLGGFGISRYTLDNALYEIAKTKGVYVVTGTKVVDINFENNIFTIHAGNRNFTGYITAGSFGKRSNLDIKWKRDFIIKKTDKLSNYIGVKYHIKYPVQKENIALHNFYNGYCGLSNIEENKCCLCYLTTARNLKENNNSVAEMEKNVLWKNPLLREIFSKAEFLYKEPLVISQISFSKKKQVENHLLMIGDSAGLITPLCGNGMSMAMHAGKLAFEKIQAFLEQKIDREQMEQQYAKQWQHHFNKRLFIGRMVQKLFGNNMTTAAFLKIMHKMPWLADKLIRSTHGNSF
jgi:flavin-dependent dehydrogenase